MMGLLNVLFSKGVVYLDSPLWVFLLKIPTSFLEKLLEETCSILSTIRLGPSFTLHLQR